MTNKRPTIPCKKCGGAGKHPLSNELWETLSILRRLSKAHAEQIGLALRPRMTANAISNRLDDLLALGFVERERSGKFWIYSPAATPSVQ